jgi:NADH:ubiquinone oxidoreductase subunit 6 (subunit J)
MVVRLGEIMFANLRFIALSLFGIFVLFFFVMSLVSIFRYGKSGIVTKKAINLALFYLILSFICGSLAVITFDPTKIGGILIVLGLVIPTYIFFCCLLQYSSKSIKEDWS